MRKLMMAGVLAAVSLVGCSGTMPVATVRPYHDAVGPLVIRYTDADTSLTPDQKRIRKQTIASFERLLKQAEK